MASTADQLPVSGSRQYRVIRNADEWRLLFESRKGWNKVIMFTAAGRIVASNITADTEDLRCFITAFDDQTTAISKGVVMQGDRFEIHRWHPPLIYGRRGLPSESEGIAMIKGFSSVMNETIFLVVVYKMPFLSSQIVPHMIQFFTLYVGDIASPVISEVYRDVILNKDQYPLE